MSDIPKELFAAFKESDLDDFFSNCTDAHRKEYIKWVEEAKRLETIKQRISKAVKMILDKPVEEADVLKRHDGF
jgi:uncharacterized protein YdeI (YjbR/CyaY-like superfamily)